MLKGKVMQDAAVELARSGMRPSLIAETLNRRATTISAALSHARAAGVDVPRYTPGKPGPKATAGAQARRDALADLSRAGHPPRVVAAIVGQTPEYVSQRLYRMRLAGMEVPRSGRGRPQLEAGAALQSGQYFFP